ncbi:MAG: hypothetical protein ACRCWQ_09350 [Bacilli bacterium]
MRKKIILTASALTFSSVLAGCQSQSPPLTFTEEEYEELVKENEESEWRSYRDYPPENVDCNNWDYDEEVETWICRDRRSPSFGMWFLAGAFFNSKAGLINSSSYKKYKSSAAYTVPRSSPSKNVSTGTSGIGSGSKPSTGS